MTESLRLSFLSYKNKIERFYAYLFNLLLMMWLFFKSVFFFSFYMNHSTYFNLTRDVDMDVIYVYIYVSDLM